MSGLFLSGWLVLIRGKFHPHELCTFRGAPKVDALNKSFTPSQVNFLTSVMNQSTMGGVMNVFLTGEVKGQSIPKFMPHNTENVFFGSPKNNELSYTLTCDPRNPGKATIEIKGELAMQIQNVGEHVNDNGHVGKLPITLTLKCDIPREGKCSVTDAKLSYVMNAPSPGILDGGVSNDFKNRLGGMIPGMQPRKNY